MSDVLTKLGEKAKGAYSTLKSIPPDEGERDSLRYNQEQANSLSEKKEDKPAVAPHEEASEQDKVSPTARYGSRPGEKRIDTSEMAHPLGSIMPVYDRGGDVSIEAGRRAQSAGDSGLQSILNSPDEQPMAPKSKGAPASGGSTLTGEVADYRQQKAADKYARLTTADPDAPTIANGPAGAAPAPSVASLGLGGGLPKLYDQGGDVDVNDGKHQVAILQDGEKVLTPEQAQQYRKEHPESKGAPADFSGRVFPNPKGLKPIDSDAQPDKPTDTDRLPKGAKLSTDNAPAETPQGDISNPPAADVKPEQGREVSTQTLKPYSQVVEEKAKQKAAEQVKNPASSLQPITSNVDGQIQPNAPKEEERGTPQERAAIDADKKNAMGKGVNGFVQLGTALIHENSLPKAKDEKADQSALGKIGGVSDQGAPNTTTPNTPAAPAPQQGEGLKPLPNGAQDQKQQPSGKDLYKAKVAQYDSQYQQLMDKAGETGDPQFSEKADRVKAAKEAYLQAHPWGAPESAHPGILGRIGHVAEEVLSRAPVSGPVMTTIPGSEVSRRREAAATQADLKEQAAQNTAENKADKSTLPGYKQVTGGAIDPKDPEGKQQVAFYDEKDPSKIIYAGPVAPKAGAGADKKAFQDVLSKIGTPDVADPEQQKSALKNAHANKVISDQEYSNSLAYLGSTSNAPATQVTASNEKRTAGKTLYFDTPNGRKALTAAEAKNQGLDPNEGVVENEGQVSKDREKNSTYRVIEKSLSQYEKHVDEGKLTPKDVEVMGTITEDAESPDYISKLIGGGFDDLLGHPITGYSEKLMKSTLTKNQYQDLSPAGRQLVADYYTTMMAHFANMKAAQGTIPRNPFIIQTEMHTIPKPFLSAEEAKPAFKNYLDQVSMRNSDNVDFAGATGTKKEEPAAPTPTARPEGVPEGATHIYRDKQNNIVGYALDGKYHGIEAK